MCPAVYKVLGLHQGQTMVLARTELTFGCRPELGRSGWERDVYKKSGEEAERPRYPLLCVEDAHVAMCQEDSWEAGCSPRQCPFRGLLPGEPTCLEEVVRYIPRWKLRESSPLGYSRRGCQEGEMQGLPRPCTYSLERIHMTHFS